MWEHFSVTAFGTTSRVVCTGNVFRAQICELIIDHVCSVFCSGFCSGVCAHLTWSDEERTQSQTLCCMARILQALRTKQRKLQFFNVVVATRPLYGLSSAWKNLAEIKRLNSWFALPLLAWDLVRQGGFHIPCFLRQGACRSWADSIWEAIVSTATAVILQIGESTKNRSIACIET